MTRSSLLIPALIVPILLGCGVPFWTPPPDLPVAMARDDERRQLVGTWRIEFAVDSLREQRDGRFVLAPGPGMWVTGVIELGDTLISRWRSDVRARLSVNFLEALGRPMSCDNRGGAIALTVRRSEVQLWFTPNAHDCGFSARGILLGESVTGTWVEHSFAGYTAAGRFRMKRAS